jgi:hypothetical protein
VQIKKFGREAMVLEESYKNAFGVDTSASFFY